MLRDLRREPRAATSVVSFGKYATDATGAGEAPSPLSTPEHVPRPFLRQW